MSTQTAGDAGALAASFADALTAAGGVAHHAVDLPGAHVLVQDLCAGRPTVVDRDPVLDGVAPVTPATDVWAAGVGVTTALAAVAGTGTLVLAFDADHPRRTSLAPPVHVAVVPVDRLVPRYQDAMDLLAARRPLPSGVRLVTGPSASADIEMTLVRGMHGPGEVHVVLAGP